MRGIFGAVFCIWAAAAQAFFPSDPLFAPGTGGGAAEGYYGHWHLVNQAPLGTLNAGLDVNIRDAWARGLTGQGVVVGIIDDGVESSHPDLSEAFVNEFSWGFTFDLATNLAQANRGSPVFSGARAAGLPFDSHGTGVAGVAAARGGNGIGGAGAAPQAGIAALRFLVNPGETYAMGKTGSQAEAAAVLYQGGGDPFAPVNWASFAGRPPVRIKNHSYGAAAFIPRILTWAALEESAENNVIHVKSAGNSRSNFQAGLVDSNREPMANQTTLIVVAAMGSDGRVASYSSRGANIFVTAPSSSQGLFAIPTTDRTTPADGYNSVAPGENYLASLPEYTSRFGGTSSAAPLVSGIMALGVQANPNLNVRLAQHALVATSRQVDAANPSWVTNAAGNRFSADYGFGLIDANAFTSHVVGLQVVPNSVQVFSSEVIDVPPEAGAFSNLNRTISRQFEANFSSPWTLEAVRLTLSFGGFLTEVFEDASNEMLTYEGAILGDLSGWVTSAAGTRYPIFFDDTAANGTAFYANRFHRTDELAWTFTSNAYWGESIDGTWTVEIVNHSASTSGGGRWGVWEDFMLDFHTGQVIPEPSTVLLVLAGAAWIVFGVRRRKSPETLSARGRGLQSV